MHLEHRRWRACHTVWPRLQARTEKPRSTAVVAAMKDTRDTASIRDTQGETMRTTALCLFLVITVSSARAHDASQHKGKPVTGTVSSVNNDTLVLSTGTGPLNVTLTPNTKIERGEQDAGRAALVNGAGVAIFGTKVPGQGLVAKEIVLDAKTVNERHEGHETHRK